jgi:hypothetical protein
MEDDDGDGGGRWKMMMVFDGGGRWKMMMVMVEEDGDG